MTSRKRRELLNRASGILRDAALGRRAHLVAGKRAVKAGKKKKSSADNKMAEEEVAVRDDTPCVGDQSGIVLKATDENMNHTPDPATDGNETETTGTETTSEDGATAHRNDIHGDSVTTSRGDVRETDPSSMATSSVVGDARKHAQKDARSDARSDAQRSALWEDSVDNNAACANASDDNAAHHNAAQHNAAQHNAAHDDAADAPSFATKRKRHASLKAPGFYAEDEPSGFASDESEGRSPPAKRRDAQTPRGAAAQGTPGGVNDSLPDLAVYENEANRTGRQDADVSSNQIAGSGDDAEETPSRGHVVDVEVHVSMETSLDSVSVGTVTNLSDDASQNDASATGSAAADGTGSDPLLRNRGSSRPRRGEGSSRERDAGLEGARGDLLASPSAGTRSRVRRARSSRESVSSVEGASVRANSTGSHSGSRDGADSEMTSGGRSGAEDKGTGEPEARPGGECSDDAFTDVDHVDATCNERETRDATMSNVTALENGSAQQTSRDSNHVSSSLEEAEVDSGENQLTAQLSTEIDADTTASQGQKEGVAAAPPVEKSHQVAHAVPQKPAPRRRGRPRRGSGRAPLSPPRPPGALTRGRRRSEGLSPGGESTSSREGSEPRSAERPWSPGSVTSSEGTSPKSRRPRGRPRARRVPDQLPVTWRVLPAEASAKLSLNSVAMGNVENTVADGYAADSSEVSGCETESSVAKGGSDAAVVKGDGRNSVATEDWPLAEQSVAERNAVDTGDSENAVAKDENAVVRDDNTVARSEKGVARDVKAVAKDEAGDAVLSPESGGAVSATSTPGTTSTPGSATSTFVSPTSSPSAFSPPPTRGRHGSRPNTSALSWRVPPVGNGEHPVQPETVGTHVTMRRAMQEGAASWKRPTSPGSDTGSEKGTGTARKRHATTKVLRLEVDTREITGRDAQVSDGQHSPRRVSPRRRRPSVSPVETDRVPGDGTQPGVWRASPRRQPHMVTGPMVMAPMVTGPGKAAELNRESSETETRNARRRHISSTLTVPLPSADLSDGGTLGAILSPRCRVHVVRFTAKSRGDMDGGAGKRVETSGGGTAQGSAGTRQNAQLGSREGSTAVVALDVLPQFDPLSSTPALQTESGRGSPQRGGGGTLLRDGASASPGRGGARTPRKGLGCSPLRGGRDGSPLKARSRGPRPVMGSPDSTTGSESVVGSGVTESPPGGAGGVAPRRRRSRFPSDSSGPSFRGDRDTEDAESSDVSEDVMTSRYGVRHVVMKGPGAGVQRTRARHASVAVNTRRGLRKLGARGASHAGSRTGSRARGHVATDDESWVDSSASLDSQHSEERSASERGRRRRGKGAASATLASLIEHHVTTLTSRRRVKRGDVSTLTSSRDDVEPVVSSDTWSDIFESDVESSTSTETRRAGERARGPGGVHSPGGQRAARRGLEEPDPGLRGVSQKLRPGYGEPDLRLRLSPGEPERVGRAGVRPEPEDPELGLQGPQNLDPLDLSEIPRRRPNSAPADLGGSSREEGAGSPGGEASRSSWGDTGLGLFDVTHDASLELTLARENPLGVDVRTSTPMGGGDGKPSAPNRGSGRWSSDTAHVTKMRLRSTVAADVTIGREDADVTMNASVDARTDADVVTGSHVNVDTDPHGDAGVDVSADATDLDPRVTCASCSATFPRPQELFLHQLETDHFRRYCCLCARHFWSEATMLDHVLSEDHSTADHVFPGEDHVDHVAREDHHVTGTLQDDVDALRLLVCARCDATFPRRAALRRHLAEKHGTWVCALCEPTSPRSFADEEVLREHCAAEHREQQQVT